MSHDTLHYEIRDDFTLITPLQLGPEELDDIPAMIEDLLTQKKQDVVLSLDHVSTVFSTHLTAFVQIYRLMQGFQLKLVVVDISPAVLNVMQMTQLDSLIPLYLSLEDYVESRSNLSAQGTSTEELSFSYQIETTAEGIKVLCKGYMAYGPQTRTLYGKISESKNILLDLTQVGYMDTRVLIMVSDLANKTNITVQGATNVIRELFEQHRIDSRVQFIEEP